MNMYTRAIKCILCIQLVNDTLCRLLNVSQVVFSLCVVSFATRKRHDKPTVSNKVQTVYFLTMIYVFDRNTLRNNNIFCKVNLAAQGLLLSLS